MLTGEVGLDFGKESELEETGFDNGTDMLAIKSYTKIFGSGTDIGDEGIRGIVGGDSVVIEYYDFGFILVKCQEIVVHPGLNVV